MHLIDRLRRRGSAEDGSIMIAVMVIFIGTIAVLTVMSSVTSNLTQARTEQSRSNAFQYANAGVDQAVYRIDSGDLPTAALPDNGAREYTPILSAGDPIVPDGELIGYTEQVDVEGQRYDLEVTQNPPGQTTTWKVRSTGYDAQGEKRRMAIATVEAERLFEHGFFTLNEFNLTGAQNTAAPLIYNSANPACTDPRGKPACNLEGTVQTRFGTNDEFDGATATITDLEERWGAQFSVYGSPSIEDARARCFGGRCQDEDVFNHPDLLEVEVPAMPAAATQPPGGCTINGGTIPPGDYFCSDLVLSGTIQIGGTDAQGVRIWVQDTVSAGGAIVNRGKRPMRFQLFVPEESTAGDQRNGLLCRSEIWGLLYTPGITINCGGGHQPTIYGAVVAKLHDGRGNHFDFHWDYSSRNAVNNGLYHVRNWRECPPGPSDC